MQAALSATTEPWSVSIEARPGVHVPTLGPMEAREAPSSVEAAVGKAPWPGLLRWAWRMVFGGGDATFETRVLRAQFRAVTDRRWHRLGASLSGGELLVFMGRYMTAQVAWVGRVSAQAAREIEEQSPSPAAMSPAPSAPAPATLAASAGRPMRIGPHTRMVMPDGTRVGGGAGAPSSGGRRRVPWTPEEMVRRYGDGRQQVPAASAAAEGPAAKEEGQ